MTTYSGSSGGGSGGGSSESNTERKRNPNGGPANLTGSFSAGTIGTPRVDKGTPAQAHKGSDNDGNSVINIKPVPTSIVSGASSTPPQAFGGSVSGSNAGAVDTTVVQRPTPTTPTPAPDGPEKTVVTAGPRSDFSVVLAGQVGRRPDRSPARSNNFVSLVGGSGGLGRKTSEAKRSLIGGA